MDRSGWVEGKRGENQCWLRFSLNILFLVCCPSAPSQNWNYAPAYGLISFKTNLDEKEIMKSSRISPKFKRVQPQKTNNSNLYSLAPVTLLPSTASTTSRVSGLCHKFAQLKLEHIILKEFCLRHLTKFPSKIQANSSTEKGGSHTQRTLAQVTTLCSSKWSLLKAQNSALPQNMELLDG